MSNGVTFRADWLDLIDRLPGEVSRARLAYAVLQRLIRGATPPLPRAQEWVYALIEREILVSERQRRNIVRRWHPSAGGTVRGTIPGTIPGTVPGTIVGIIPPPIPNADFQGARPHEETPEPPPRAAAPESPAPAHHSPACAPASSTALARGVCYHTSDSGEKNKRKERKKGDKSPKKETENVPIPSALNHPAFLEAWDRWREYRRAKKKTLSVYAAKLQLKLLAQYAPNEAVELLEQSMRNDWQGVFPKKGGRPQTARPPEKDYTGI